MKTIYLAGPDVFRALPLEHFKKLKTLCEKYGFIGFSPFDNENDFNGQAFSKEHSTHIFSANVGTINVCDIIVANLTPFRGACIDDGTAWEIGYGYAIGKLIYGYTNNYLIKLANQIDVKAHSDSLLEFPGIESFGDNCVNLMIQESIELSGGKILKTFEDCLLNLKHNENKYGE